MLPQPSLMLIPFGWLCCHGDVRAKFAQNARRRFVGGAICDVHSHSHFLERHSTWKTCLGEFDVATERIIDARGASDFAGRWPNGIDLAAENELLDSVLNLIIQLVTVVPEKFDAVVLDKDYAKPRGRCRRRRAAIA